MTKFQYTIYSLVCIFEYVFIYVFVYTDFPGGSVVKRICRPMQETQVQSLDQEDPL